MVRKGESAARPAYDYLNTKVDNAIALRDLAIKYGKYPIEF